MREKGGGCGLAEEDRNLQSLLWGECGRSTVHNSDHKVTFCLLAITDSN